MTRTLVAEDDTDIREIVVMLLRRAGHQVTAVNDGVDAQRALDLRVFDLLVTDHHMPRMGGAEVVAHLHRSGMRTRALLMSADHRVARMDVVVDGRASFLRKPFGGTRLLGAVEALMGPPPPGRFEIQP
ncbi:response regulator [Nocardioides okcheonensis]|uniref:response regulator n=1 Tax=Nocardioides okcheonensis TaxID=2894081 RepID=UPI001E637251|nr:response regulator [Nocardioides okcheonensis]UFN45118.1 response regulator [Nocardioides okcheonensis]